MKKTIIGLVGVTALCATALSMAADVNMPANKDSGLYVGADLGYGGYTGSTAETLLGGFYKKKKGFVFGAHVGYDFDKYIAAQVEYLYLPKLNLRPGFTGTSGNSRNQMFALEAKVMYPVLDGKLIPFADAGAALILHSNRFPGDTADTGRNYKWRPVVGAGVEYKVMPSLGVSVAYKAIIGSTKSGNNQFPTTQMGLAGVNYYF